MSRVRRTLGLPSTLKTRVPLPALPNFSLMYKPIIPEPGKQRQEDQKYKVILSYRVDLKPRWATRDSIFKKRQMQSNMAALSTMLIIKRMKKPKALI